jgi:UDP-3-O-[3-hydroxymyristoyl] glucosamine N-acyltransferase
MPSLTVSQIAAIVHGSPEGDPERVIVGANALEAAQSNELSFVANQKAAQLADKSEAGCLLVPTSFDKTGTWSLIRVADARIAFVHVLSVLYPKRKVSPLIDPTAIIAVSAKIAPDCSIGPYTTIGEETQIASGCSIGAGCRIGSQVVMGENTTVHPNVTIYDGVRIGNRVLLHAGCVLGADGFGFTLVKDHYEKFPQVGTVEIGDDVEIGANSCVDRAALGVTRIGEGTKLDNLVHIAHNCTIGKHVIIAAQTGLSGGVVIGDYAFIGGQTGIADKAKIEPKAIVAAKSGILTSQKVLATEPVWGIPARPLRQHLKNLAHIGKLPEMREELQELKLAVAELKNKQLKEL